MPIFALTIFTGAFLLFQVQPLIGKYILPWFGGGPGVWTTCMLFFQALLLGGYAYAHFAARLKPRTQAIVHLVLLVVALALLPITPSETWKPHGGENPTLRILALLTASLGLPYFILSSTGPLLQQWFSRANPGQSPYRLYALSNAGSLLALVTYPFLVESYLARKSQATLWAAGLVVYALCCALCAVRLWKSEAQSLKSKFQSPKPDLIAQSAPTSPTLSTSTTPPISVLNQSLWLLLPACASVLLLATTNRLCQDMTVLPFLWVLPLALYLLSFIVCFDNSRWYARYPFSLALLAAFAGLAWAMPHGNDWPLWRLVAIYSGGLFVCCMVCHGELYRLRPEPCRLTAFYLLIAGGGSLGGLFVAVAAPLLFTGYYELYWGLLLCGLLVLLVWVTDRSPDRSALSLPSHRNWHRAACVGLALGIVALGAVLWFRREKFPTDVLASRNFYGVLRVFKERIGEPKEHLLGLMHGRIWHGWQFVDPERATWPTLYYGEQSGVGLALCAMPPGNRRIGVVGLGIGTLAAYAQPGDYMRFYEINPEVQRIAAARFTCLAGSPGRIEIALGDARLSLEREPPQQFDLLALDAFSSDAIPVHLLTRESFELYARHLKTNGVIAVHISNHYLDLEYVLVNVARHFNYRLAVVENIPSPDQWWLLPSLWILLTRDPAILDSPAIRDAARPEEPDSERVPLWTDDFTSVFQILKSGTSPQVALGTTATDLRIASRLINRGNLAEAIAQYRLVLKSQPDLVLALNNLAWLLATSPEASLRNGPEAVQFAEKACRLTRYCAPYLVGTLAAAYAEAGRFPEAIATAQKACNRAVNYPDLLEQNRQHLELYRRGQPYREPATAPAEHTFSQP